MGGASLVGKSEREFVSADDLPLDFSPSKSRASPSCLGTVTWNCPFWLTVVVLVFGTPATMVIRLLKLPLPRVGGDIGVSEPIDRSISYRPK